MMRTLVLVALFAAAGCATIANSSAPGKDPSTIYVAGQKQDFFGPAHEQVWLCPSTPGKTDCKEIEVEEVSK
jgi:uncharacterized protein YceK